MTNDTVYTFRPDFISQKKVILLSVTLVVTIISGLLFAFSGDPFSIFGTLEDSDELLLVTGIFGGLFLGRCLLYYSRIYRIPAK